MCANRTDPKRNESDFVSIYNSDKYENFKGAPPFMGAAPKVSIFGSLFVMMLAVLSTVVVVWA
jgi:hypothetical protein